MRKLLIVAAVAGVAACNPDLIDTAYQDYTIELWGPDVANGAVDPFAETQKIEVTVRFWEDAAGTVPYGSKLTPEELGETFKDFSPIVPVTMGGTQKTFSLSKDGPAIVLPRLREGQASIFVSAEIIGRNAANAPVARARCLVQELKQKSGAAKVTCKAFYGLLGRWNTVPSPSQNRTHFAAAALPDGRVVIAGGRDGNTALSAVEVFDPATQAWAKVGDLSEARYGLTGTVTEKGFVIFAGGKLSESSFSAAVDVFDPSGAGSVRASQSLSSVRYDHAAALQGGETVIVAAGMKTSNAPLISPERVTSTGAPQLISNASSKHRRNACMVAVEKNLMLLCGGKEKSCETFDGAQFREVGTIGSGVEGIALDAPRCAAVDGLAFIIGGSQVTGSKEIFVWKKGDVAPQRFQDAPDARAGHAVAVANGHLVVAGGWLVGDNTQAPRSTGFLINPNTNEVNQLAGPDFEMRAKRSNHRMVGLRDGTVMVIGGAQSSTDPIAEIFVVE